VTERDWLAEDPAPDPHAGLSLQEILDTCFGVDAKQRANLTRGKVSARLLRSFDWVTGLPKFRWQSALGLIGIAAGPQILWWQSREATLLTWLSPLPALAAGAWWAGRYRAYARLVRDRLEGRMVHQLEGVARTSTRWTTGPEGEAIAHLTLHVCGESFPLPSRLGSRIVEGRVRIHILSLPSLAHPSSPPTRWLAGVDLLDPT